jgi:hypothetical protein
MTLNPKPEFLTWKYQWQTAYSSTYWFLVPWMLLWFVGIQGVDNFTLGVVAWYAGSLLGVPGRVYLWRYIDARNRLKELMRATRE